MKTFVNLDQIKIKKHKNVVIFDTHVQKMVTDYNHYLWSKNSPKMAALWAMYIVRNIEELANCLRSSNPIGICFSVCNRTEFELIESLKEVFQKISKEGDPPEIVLFSYDTFKRDRILIARSFNIEDIHLSTGDWVNIPDDIVSTIIGFLDEEDDFENFARTCKRFFVLNINIRNREKLENMITDKEIDGLKVSLNAKYIRTTNPITIYRKFKRQTNPLKLVSIGQRPT